MVHTVAATLGQVTRRKVAEPFLLMSFDGWPECLLEIRSLIDRVCRDHMQDPVPHLCTQIQTAKRSDSSANSYVKS